MDYHAVIAPEHDEAPTVAVVQVYPTTGVPRTWAGVREHHVFFQKPQVPGNVPRTMRILRRTEKSGGFD